MLQAILIGLIVFIGKADYFIGTAMFGRPLVLGALVGIVLGDIPTGVMIGFQLELIFMGMQAIGASIPPDMIVGSVLGNRGIDGNWCDGSDDCRGNDTDRVQYQ